MCASQFRSSALKTLFLNLLYIETTFCLAEINEKIAFFIELMNDKSIKGLAKYYVCVVLIGFCKV